MRDRISRRASMKVTATAAAIALTGPTQAAPDEQMFPTHTDTLSLPSKGKRIPVIFDTDIGTDVDDTWALLYLLNCPEFDIRLVSTDAGLGNYRARLTAKFLTHCGRDEIPISVCEGAPNAVSHQQDWVGDYDLHSYRGAVHEDSVDAIIQTVHASADPVTLICVGAVPNIAAALRRDPTLCRNARFVGMHGAIHVGYGGSAPPVPEANVRSNPTALRDVFAAPWQCSITPLDTCGTIDLEDERYAKVYQSKAKGVVALMQNYAAWLKRVPWLAVKPDPAKRSSTLFDLVAVYMAHSEDLLQMETLGIAIDEHGLTTIDESSPPVRCAMKWHDQAAFEDQIVQRLLNPL